MKVYPKNKIAAFTVQLAHQIDFGRDRWEVELCEISCPPPDVGALNPKVVVGDAHALIYCTLIIPQLVSEKKVPCIRIYIHLTAFCNHVCENVYYQPVEKRNFRDIRIKIADRFGNPTPFKDSKTPAKVVLHFRRVFHC